MGRNLQSVPGNGATRKGFKEWEAGCISQKVTGGCADGCRAPPRDARAGGPGSEARASPTTHSEARKVGPARFFSPRHGASPLPPLLETKSWIFFFLKLPQFEPIIWGEVSVTTVSVSVCGTVSVFYTLPSPRAPSSSDRVPAPAASPPGPLELAAPAPVRSPSGLPACLPPAPSRCPRSQPLAGAERAAPRGPRAPAEQLPCRPQVLT